MTGTLIAALGIRATAITEWVVAVLSVTFSVMIVIGLVRVWRARRCPRVVIEDVEPDEGVPAEMAAGLSLQLKRAVRGVLRRQSDDARLAAMETLEEDGRAGLVTVHGAITMRAVEELDRTTQDSMSLLSAGLRAVGPKEAEGLAAALELAIPTQRGWSVHAFAAIRGADMGTQAGLSVEVAPLGRTPEVPTTFWTTSTALQQSTSDAARLAATREIFRELVQPVSVWIAIRLVSQHLMQTRSWYRGLVPSRRGRERELAGLQAQLGGQMLLYATRTQQQFIGGFADDALDDLKRAARLLPQYYRPHLTQAAVHERLGWSYLHSGDDPGAHLAFVRAVEAYDKAEKLLVACDQADTVKRDAAIERLALRRTKCRLLSRDHECADTALQELSRYSRLKDVRPVPLYNAACLFAVAMACPDLPYEQRALSERRAWHYLGIALVCSPHGSGLWPRMMTDEELCSLDASRRKEFGDHLKNRYRRPLAYHEADLIVEAAIAELGLTDPGAQGAAV
jgi:hypothetical protein